MCIGVYGVAHDAGEGGTVPNGIPLAPCDCNTMVSKRFNEWTGTGTWGDPQGEGPADFGVLPRGDACAPLFFTSSVMSRTKGRRFGFRMRRIRGTFHFATFLAHPWMAAAETFSAGSAPCMVGTFPHHQSQHFDTNNVVEMSPLEGNK